MNVRLFMSSMIITIAVTTGLLLMPFAEYNSSRFMTEKPERMTEISFEEDTVTVGIFGERLSVQTKPVKDRLIPFVPNAVKLSEELVRLLKDYMGEALCASPFKRSSFALGYSRERVLHP